MNSAYIWIFFPGLVAVGLLLLYRRGTLVAILGTLVTLLLAGLAVWLPSQEQIFIWRWVIPFSDTFVFFGRRFVLSEVDRPSLIVIYLTAALWFGAVPIARPVKLFVPLGLAMAALLTAAIAVEPFLFAAVIIEIAVLVSIPFISPPSKKVGRGALRYLSFQTIGMPFILISGFMLTGFEVSPGDQVFAIIAVALLAIGFALLLGVFPFHTWIPMLSQESHPHSTAFVLLLLPIAVSLLGLGFLDGYVWIKEAPNTAFILLTVGVLMIMTGGMWAAVERNLARMMAFALILEIGFSFLALGLASLVGSGMYRGFFFAALIPRGISLGLWALALSSLMRSEEGTMLGDIQGIGRKYPVIAIGMILSIFSLAGVPLLASFSMRLGVIEGLAVSAPRFAMWAVLGSLGLLVGGIRTLIAIVSGTDDMGWEMNESRILIVYLSIGIIGLVILGIFPNLFFQMLVDLPSSFGQFIP